jgi:hypothetical protein
MTHGIRSSRRSRAVVAASQHLHDEIASLRGRARALESALGTLHFQSTGSIHPLIGEENGGLDDDDDDDLDKLTTGIAVLHLSNGADGMQRFFGNVQLPQGITPVPDHAGLAQLPLVLDRSIRSFPFPTRPNMGEHATAVLRSYLPDRARVERVLDKLFEEYLYMIPAVGKTQIFVELLPGLYDARLALPASAAANQERGDSPRAFALLYALLAHAALLDVGNPDRHSHATTLSRLSLAGLGAISVFEKPSYTAALALVFLATYHMMPQQEFSDMGRCFHNLAFQIAIQVSRDRIARNEI